jgi:hypothetical protein
VNHSRSFQEATQTLCPAEQVIVEIDGGAHGAPAFGGICIQHTSVDARFNALIHDWAQPAKRDPIILSRFHHGKSSRLNHPNINAGWRSGKRQL